MAMVDTVYWLPKGWPVAQAGWLGPKVGDHLAPCCAHLVNRANSHNGSAMVSLVLLLLLLSNCLKQYT